MYYLWGIAVFLFGIMQFTNIIVENLYQKAIYGRFMRWMMLYVSFPPFSNRGLFRIFALTSMIKTNHRQSFVSHAHPSIFKVENCASLKSQQNRPCELALPLYIINALLIHRKHNLVNCLIGPIFYWWKQKWIFQPLFWLIWPNNIAKKKTRLKQPLLVLVIMRCCVQFAINSTSNLPKCMTWYNYTSQRLNVSMRFI